jgi:hypothetical protein
MRAVVLLLAASMAMSAADLESIRATQAKLVKLRPKGDTVYPLPDPPPEFAELKHQIRDWAEQKITKLPRDADLEAATSRVDGELLVATITHGDEPDLGDVEGIRLDHTKGDASWLVLSTTVWEGSCTRSNSIYLYEWQGGGWTRRFELEDRIEDIEHVEIGPPDAYQNRLVLVLGNSWGCASMWQGLSYRLFRIGSAETKLAGGDDTIYIGDGDTYQGKLETHGALIEYLGSSVDTGVLIRRHVLHFQFDGDSVKRVEPFALTAQDFLDESLSSHDEVKLSTFDFVQHCPGNADRWQIGVSPDPYGDESADPKAYFMIEQLPGYRFRILDIAPARQPGCPGKDAPRGTGDPYPTLFPARKP